MGIREEFDRAYKFKKGESYEKFFLNIAKEKDICIFGGGTLGKLISKWLISVGITPCFFCDNNVKMKDVILEGCIPYIAFEELEQYKENIYVIVAVANRTTRYNDEICKQLKEFPHVMYNPLGITIYLSQIFDIDSSEFEKKVQCIRENKYFVEPYSEKLYEYLLALRMQADVVDYNTNILDSFYNEKQYIAEELIDYKKINSYIDCGAFTGDSLNLFIAISNTKANYHLFEMDLEIRKKLLDNIEKQYSDKKEQIKVYPYGVGKEHTFVSYVSDITGGSRISEVAEKQAEIVALDEIEFDGKIDFIKMDIEGAEEEALLGAREIISREHPILAISMYHSLGQFVRIPYMIHNLEPNYELYLRHHKHTIDDTVLYAIYKKEN